MPGQLRVSDVGLLSYNANRLFHMLQLLVSYLWRRYRALRCNDMVDLSSCIADQCAYFRPV